MAQLQYFRTRRFGDVSMCSCRGCVVPKCTVCRGISNTALCVCLQGGGQAQHAALVAALLKNVYNADPANKPWAELMARYLFR